MACCACTDRGIVDVTEHIRPCRRAGCPAHADTLASTRRAGTTVWRPSPLASGRASSALLPASIGGRSAPRGRNQALTASSIISAVRRRPASGSIARRPARHGPVNPAAIDRPGY